MPHTAHTTCPLDCPDTCALEVTTTNGMVTGISGRSEQALTQWFICSKVASFSRRLTHEDRLLYPMRRVGAKGVGEFERISWDEAIDQIVTRFREIIDEWGGEAILPYNYGGSNGVLTDGFLDTLFFARLGSSRLARTLCAAPATAVAAGMYGKMPGVAFEDYPLAKCIVIWGANPKASNIHLVPLVREAKRRGAFVAVVDPLRNFSSNEVDLHLAVKPGTDLPVALAMINHWRASDCIDATFLAGHATNQSRLLDAASQWSVERAAEEAGVDAADIVTLADMYARRSPAIIRCGWGIERNKNGGQAIAAVLAMPALLGKFGVRGGGYTLSNNGAARLDRDRLFDMPEWRTRSVNMTQIGKFLTDGLDPPIKAMFVYNCNPLVTVPDQQRVMRGLSRDDVFTVVFDQVKTDTVLYADVVLPATTFLEHWDVRVSYGTYVVGGVRPVVPAAGEARSNMSVFGALGRAMGFSDKAFSWDDETAFRHAASALTANGTPVDAAALENGHLTDYAFPERNPVQFETVFPNTGDGKIDLCPASLGNLPYGYKFASRDDFPLQLISPATSKLISSTLGEYNLPTLTVLIHPSDADRRGMTDRARVRVFNQLGEVVCHAVVRDKTRPGVVSMPKGAWRKSSENGFTATALCPAHVNDVAGGACFNDARVEIEKMDDRR